MSQPQFLVDFENSINKLAEMNKNIQTTVQEKNTFNQKLYGRLQKINDLVKQLSGDINNLKAKVDDLQSQVNSNSTAVGDKDKQIADLNARINNLEAEKQQLINQITDAQNQINAAKTEMQQKIDEYETQVRSLTDENTTLKNQASALTAELNGKGDLQGQHAEQIKTQTEEFQKQLEQQQLANKDEIDKLMIAIKEKEDQIVDLQNQLQIKSDEVANQVKNIDDVNNKAKSDIENLNKEIANLKAENDDLIKRIITATDAISEATENLRLLSETAPNPKSDKELDDLFNEIENSIKGISSAIQGNPSPSVNKKVQVNDTNGNPRDIMLQKALSQLQTKLQSELIPERATKIQTAIDFIKNNRANLDEISKYLIQNGFQFAIGNDNVTLSGGKKRTKKNRKQKGGFTYKKAMKRKSLLTSVKSLGGGRKKARGRTSKRK